MAKLIVAFYDSSKMIESRTTKAIFLVDINKIYLKKPFQQSFSVLPIKNNDKVL
jgi:hypothetical protein